MSCNVFNRLVSWDAQQYLVVWMFSSGTCHRMMIYLVLNVLGDAEAFLFGNRAQRCALHIILHNGL